jgi:cytochrome c553
MKKILIIAAVLAFGATAHAADPAAGKEKSKVCAACHGETGATPIADNPKLAGQYYDYLLRALNDYKLGVRKNPVMSGMVASLKREDMADLAAYFSSQQALAQK